MKITAGNYKGTKLNTFELDNIRPTLDIVRQSIFNKIQFNISGHSFLDLFAGTGAFSLEAKSRGANNVVAVDNNKDSINLIKSNIKKCNSDIEIINKDYIKALEFFNENNYSFDFVFLDPPFNFLFIQNVLDKLLTSKVINEDSLVIFESDLIYKSFNNYKIIDIKKYGKIFIYYLRAIYV